MKNPRMLLAIAALIVFGAIGPGHSQTPRCEPEKAAAKYPAYAGKTVKIGMSPTQPPYAFSDPANPERATGLEVEMIENAMNCAGLKFEYMKGAWAGLLQSLFSGGMDVMIGNVNYRPDRGEKADFVLYLRAGQTTVVPKGNPKKITDNDGLCGMTGSATIGGTSARFIELQSKACVDRGRPAINYLPAADAEAAYRQVGVGRIDFAMDDSASAAARVAKEQVREYEIAYNYWTDIVSGLVVAKGNAAMLQVVADGLAMQQQSGMLASLMTKYGLSPQLLIPIEARK